MESAYRNTYMSERQRGNGQKAFGDCSIWLCIVLQLARHIISDGKISPLFSYFCSLSRRLNSQSVWSPSKLNSDNDPSNFFFLSVAKNDPSNLIKQKRREREYIEEAFQKGFQKVDKYTRIHVTYRQSVCKKKIIP